MFDPLIRQDRYAPDYLFLVSTAKSLDLFAVKQQVFRNARLLWRESVETNGRQLNEQTLYAITSKHPVKSETEVVLVAPPGTGGTVVLPSVPNGQRNRSWLERQLSLALPFQPQEIVWRVRHCEGLIEIFWLPLAWVNSAQDVLKKAGLKLREIYPRAALFRNIDASSPTPPFMIHEDIPATGGALYGFADGLIRRTTELPIDEERANSQLVLERHSFEAVFGPVALRSETLPGGSHELFALLWTLWSDGRDGISIDANRWQVWQPILRIGAIISVLGGLAAAGLVLHLHYLEDNLHQLNQDYRTLVPVLARYKELERSTLLERRFLAAAAEMDRSPVPHAALSAITAALPDTFWIQKAIFRGGILEIAGRGGDNSAVVDLLGKNHLVATALSAEGDASSDTFRVAVNLGPAEGKQTK
ncbi:MAG: hypothetical protein Q8O25_05575 [Sulfurisoma sp.]|nr:hypothetical protein [Sulfurisoma sp.]